MIDLGQHLSQSLRFTWGGESVFFSTALNGFQMNTGLGHHQLQNRWDYEISMCSQPLLHQKEPTIAAVIPLCPQL